jgi:chromosome segregation ATPase
MATVASVRSEKSPSSGLSLRQLSQSAEQELATLRAALDQKLATLEAALANPSRGESLETLIIDLARVATAEAETAATKACVDSQLEAQRQAAARAEAQRALRTERDALVAFQRDLEQARRALASEREITTVLRRDLDTAATALKAEREGTSGLRRRAEDAEAKYNAERAAGAALRRDIEDTRRAVHAAQQAGLELNQSAEQAHAELENEQATVVSLRQALNDAHQQIASIKAAAQTESRSAREQFDDQTAGERAAHLKLTAALESVKQELAAARHVAEKQAADVDAAQSLIEGLERQRAGIERARHEDVARANALADERDALVRELNAARQAADHATTRADAGAEQFEAERAGNERVVSELHARFDAVVRERESLRADLTAARNTLDAAKTQAEEQSQSARRDIERSLRDAIANADAAIRDRDFLAEELELTRISVAAAQDESQAQLDAIRKAAAQRIADLEAALQQRNRDETEPASPPRDSLRDAHAIPLAPADMPEPTLAGPATRPAPAHTSPTTPHGSPVRRASRQAFQQDVQVLIDGSPATLVDLSISGAQVVSHTALKPNRMVRVQLPAEDNPITCKGKIVWARLEAGSTTGLRYRAGVFFTGVDERAVEKFLAEYVANQPAG